LVCFDNFYKVKLKLLDTIKTWNLIAYDAKVASICIYSEVTIDLYLR
jgi:hypothetical protein